MISVSWNRNWNTLICGQSNLSTVGIFFTLNSYKMFQKNSIISKNYQETFAVCFLVIIVFLYVISVKILCITRNTHLFNISPCNITMQYLKKELRTLLWVKYKQPANSGGVFHLHSKKLLWKVSALLGN